MMTTGREQQDLLMPLSSITSSVLTEEERLLLPGCLAQLDIQMRSLEKLTLDSLLEYPEEISLKICSVTLKKGAESDKALDLLNIIIDFMEWNKA